MIVGYTSLSSPREKADISFEIKKKRKMFFVCSSILFSFLFDSTSSNFLFRWSITGLTLKPLSVLSSYILSAKWRFWSISQKRFRIIVFWIILFPIKLSTLQHSAIGNKGTWFLFVSFCLLYPFPWLFILLFIWLFWFFIVSYHVNVCFRSSQWSVQCNISWQDLFICN